MSTVTIPIPPRPTPYHTTFLPTIHSWRSIQGWFDFPGFYQSVANQLISIATPECPVVAVEVGSWLGQSTAFFADRLQRAGGSAAHFTFYAVDTWQGSPTEANHQRIVAKHGGSVFEAFQKNMERCGLTDWVKPIRKPSVEAAAEFADHSIDFVFIDGDHQYESVKADIAAWLPKIREGGCIAGHDYDWSGVHRAVNEAFPGKFKIWGQSTVWLVDGVSKPADGEGTTTPD